MRCSWLTADEKALNAGVAIVPEPRPRPRISLHDARAEGNPASLVNVCIRSGNFRARRKSLANYDHVVHGEYSPFSQSQPSLHRPVLPPAPAPVPASPGRGASTERSPV